MKARRILFFAWIFSTIAFFSGLFYDSTSAYSRITAYSSFLFFFISLVRSLVVKDYKIIGDIILNNELIRIISKKDELSYALSEVDSLYIELNEAASDLVGRMSSAEGINNCFNFNIGEKKFEYMFYLKDRTQFTHFSSFLNKLRHENNDKTTIFKEKGRRLIFSIKKPTANTC